MKLKQLCLYSKKIVFILVLYMYAYSKKQMIDLYDTMIKTMLFQKKKNGKVGENQCFIESVACIIIHMLNLSKVSIFACGISVNINT